MPAESSATHVVPVLRPEPREPTLRSPSGDHSRCRTWAITLFLVSVALRLIYSGLVDLLPQEAYYWNYAQHPAMSYFDHPPMVAWVITLGTTLFGNSEFGVRVGPIALSVLATCWIVGLTRNLYGRGAAWGALLVCGTLPFVVMPGLIATPDAPLIAFWAGTLYFVERALHGKRRGAWFGAGLCFGLGLLSKYTIVLLGAATFAYMLTDRDSRAQLRRPQPYFATILALLVFSPVLIWNAQNDWVSFAFQGSRRLASAGRSSLPQLSGFALLLLTPPGLVLAFRSLLSPPFGDDRGAHHSRRFLATLTFIPLAVFVAYAVNHRTMRVSWTVPIWLAAVPAMAHRMEAVWARRSDARVVRLWLATCVASLVVMAILMHLISFGVPGVRLSHSRQMPVAWREVSAEVDRLSARIGQQTGRRPLVVDAETYYLASALAYYGRATRDGVAYTAGSHMLGHNGLMYRYWFNPEDWKDRTLLIVALNKEELRDAHLRHRFASVTPIVVSEVLRDGSPACSLFYRVGSGFIPPG